MKLPALLFSPSYSGWRNVLGVMIVYGGLCGNVTYAYGVFLPAMGTTFHWPRAALSGPYTMFVLVGGFLGPLAGITCARFGPRLNIIVANVLAALGLMGMSRVTDIVHVYLTFGLLCGLGIAFGEFIPVTAVVNNWFSRRRSLALGLLFAAGGVGGFIMPPVIGGLITHVGWRQAVLLLGLFHLVVVSLLGGFLVTERPENGRESPEETDSKNAPMGPYHGEWNVREAMRTHELWIIVGIFAVSLFVINILSTHQVSYLNDRGYSPLFSATALGGMLGASVVGRLIAGYLGTRYEGRRILGIALLLMAAGIAFLIHAGSKEVVYLYAILTGLGFGSAIVIIPGLTAQFFGRLHYPRIVGWTAPIVTLTAAVSPLLAGYLFDVTGSYRTPLVMTCVFTLTGAMFAWIVKPPEKPAMRDALSSPSAPGE